MQIQFVDFNGADTEIAGSSSQQWTELNSVIGALPLHLKASDQKGKQGRPIFDPVGTNQHIADQLLASGWQSGIPIPLEFEFLGKHVDFGKDGVVVEVQFSNYPFLLNNLLRSELFYRAHTVFHGLPTRLIVIVTKAGMFPSSNSTLYYEQALKQLGALARHGVFSTPIRLVGLFEGVGPIEATWTEYESRRYSRTVSSREMRRFEISKGRRGAFRITPEATGVRS